MIQLCSLAPRHLTVSSVCSNIIIRRSCIVMSNSFILIIILILTKTSVAFFRSLMTYLMECLYNCLILSKSTFVIVYSTRYLIKICTMLQVKGRGNTRCSVSIAFVKPASHEHDIECHWQDPSFHRPIQPHVIAVRSPPAYLSVIFRTGVSSGSLRIS